MFHKNLCVFNGEKRNDRLLFSQLRDLNMGKTIDLHKNNSLMVFLVFLSFYKGLNKYICFFNIKKQQKKCFYGQPDKPRGSFFGTFFSQEHIAALMGMPFDTNRPRHCVMVKAHAFQREKNGLVFLVLLKHVFCFWSYYFKVF